MKFKVSISTGLSGEFEAENKEELLKKLSTGHYSLMGVHEMNSTVITPENIASIEEIIDEN